MIELINKMNEGFNGLALTLSVYSQNNKELNDTIEKYQKYHLKKARKWQIMKM